MLKSSSGPSGYEGYGPEVMVIDHDVNLQGYELNSNQIVEQIINDLHKNHHGHGPGQDGLEEYIIIIEDHDESDGPNDPVNRSPQVQESSDLDTTLQPSFIEVDDAEDSDDDIIFEKVVYKNIPAVPAEKSSAIPIIQQSKSQPRAQSQSPSDSDSSNLKILSSYSINKIRPIFEDDRKPELSYNSVISLVFIYTKSNEPKPVQKIYQTICDLFPYFLTAPKNWKNSVRHCLSSTPLFIKTIITPTKYPVAKQAHNWSINPNKILKIQYYCKEILKKLPDPENRTKNLINLFLTEMNINFNELLENPLVLNDQTSVTVPNTVIRALKSMSSATRSRARHHREQQGSE